MNNKGVTMITVIVIIIVMIIISTVSIIAGNKIILESKSLSETEIMETVKDAVKRHKIEIMTSGSIAPIGSDYVGILSPAINDDGSTIATGWYMLNKEELNEIGVKDLSGRFLVNYDYLEVLNMQDPLYFEKYNIITFMHEEIDAKKEDENHAFVGIALENKSSEDDGKIMYRSVNSKKQTDVFGNGWYFVASSVLPSEYSENVSSDYLINYEDAKYVRVTSSFERID